MTAFAVQLLRGIRYSPPRDRIGRQTPGMRTVAKLAGISPDTIYRIARTGQCTPAQAKAVERAVAAVRNEW